MKFRTVLLFIITSKNDQLINQLGIKYFTLQQSGWLAARLQTYSLVHDPV